MQASAYAIEDHKTRDFLVYTEERAEKIGHFRPSNDGGYVCWSEFCNASKAVTNPAEAITWVLQVFQNREEKAC